MPVKPACHIALSVPVAAWVDEQVARGEYTSASDLVRTALRQMQEQDAQKVVQQVEQPVALSVSRTEEGGDDATRT